MADAHPKEQRYGISRVSLAPTNSTAEDFDPYGFEVDYYDRYSRAQGRVKLAPYMIPKDLLTPLNEALNAIVAHGLTMATEFVVPTDNVVGHSFNEPYPDVVLRPDQLKSYIKEMK